MSLAISWLNKLMLFTFSVTSLLLVDNSSMAAAIFNQLVVGCFKIVDHVLEVAHGRRYDVIRVFGVVQDLHRFGLRAFDNLDHRGNVVRDFFRGRLDPARQFTHFLGHHRKALAVLSRPRRLDGGIEGQEVEVCSEMPLMMVTMLRMLAELLPRSSTVLRKDSTMLLILWILAVTSCSSLCERWSGNSGCW